MKYKIYLGLLLLITSVKNMIGCPTCVGHIGKHAAPFFSDEFYQKAIETCIPQPQDNNNKERKDTCAVQPNATEKVNENIQEKQ